MRMIAALVAVVASLAALALATEDKWHATAPTAAAGAPAAVAEKTAPDSPFVEDHADHQQVYTALTWAIYDTLNYAAPSSANLPEANDAEGHPMWFDAADGDDVPVTLAQTLFFTEQFDNLDRLFDDWSKSKDLTADGRWRLASFHFAMTAEFSRAANWARDYPRIQRWRQAKPQSPAAAIAETVYWFCGAWSARGNGAASDATREGFELFEERLGKAEKALLESKSYASSNPLWYHEYIAVAGSQSRGPGAVLALVEEASRENPTFEANYVAATNFLTPKWGGDWALVDKFARTAVALTRDRLGQSMYLRVYLAATDCRCKGYRLLEDTYATWPQLKASFEDLVRLYPHSAYDASVYAAYACVAGDGQTYRRLRFRLGGAAVAAAYSPNYSKDVCDRKFPASPT